MEPVTAGKRTIFFHSQIRIAGNWATLSVACADRTVGSPFDEDAGPAIASARRNQYVKVLARLYGPALALATVDELRISGAAAIAGGRRPVAEPCRNADFELLGKAEPALGYKEVEAEKVAGGRATTTGETASALLRMLNMDPTVEAVAATPVSIALTHEGRSTTFIPDFEVKGIDGERWYLHLATPGMILGEGRWIARAAVAAMSDLGKQLVVVDPAAWASPVVSGAKYAAQYSTGFRLTPEEGGILSRIVEEGPADGMRFDDVLKAYTRLRWPEPPAPDTSRRRRREPEDFSGLHKMLASGALLRALREGYVDHDPGTAGQKGKYTIGRRHAFLDSHATLGLLLPWAVATTDRERLTRVDADLRAAARGLRHGERYVSTSRGGSRGTRQPDTDAVADDADVAWSPGP